MKIEKLAELVDNHAAMMGEHCDSVQIIITIVDENGSHRMLSAGRGNFYAREGSCRDWLIVNEEVNRIAARKDCRNG
jgi:hypothetical protein